MSVPRARLGAQRAVPCQHALPELPDVSRRAAVPCGGGSGDERNVDAAEHGELVRLLLELLLPLAERVGHPVAPSFLRLRTLASFLR